MSKTTHRVTLRCAGIAGLLGALILPAAAFAAAPVTIKMAPGVGGPYDGPDEPIQNAGAGQEQSVVATIEKGGRQYVVTVYMSSNVDEDLGPWQGKCTSYELDPKLGPVLVADQVLLTKNENTDRPFCRPALVSDGKNLLLGYGYAPNGGNTRTYVQAMDEACNLLTDPVKVSNNDNENIGAAHITSIAPGKFFVTYYSNNGNETRGRVVTVNGTSIEKGENKNLLAPTNIGRAPIATSKDFSLTCTGLGNNRPPEIGMACTYLDPNGEIVWKNEIIAKADEDQNLYFNQSSVVSLGNGRFALMAQESNGNGKNTDDKGFNIDHVWILEPTAEGPGIKAHTSGNAFYSTHASLLTGGYGEDGAQVLGIYEASVTNSGTASITFLRYDPQALAFKPVDKIMDSWVASTGYADSGKLSNMYGGNPNTQGRDFLYGIGDVRNPGYGLPDGWMNDTETFFVLPYNGAAKNIENEPKNAAYLTLMPGKVTKAAPPKAPSEITPANPNGVQPGVPQAPAVPSTPSNPNSAAGDGLQQANAGACSFGSGHASTAGGLAMVGLGLLAAARRRNRKES